MRRRQFITLLGGAAAAWPLAARAQQPAMPVIGFLGGDSSGLPDRLNAFRTGLSESGHVEGRNVAIEYRLTGGQNDRLPAMAADLVRAPVSVIAAGGLPAVLAVKAATTTLPVMVPKRLELLHELVPTASIMALLVNPTNPNAVTQTKDLQAAARTLGLKLHVLHASSEPDFEAVFTALAGLRAGALVIGADGLFVRRSEQLGALTVHHRVPAIFQDRGFAAAGGLASYGTGIQDAYRLVGIYTGRILKGEKPADLPVQQATKVELIINLKTAKALGLTIPLPLLGRADEVIE